MATVRFSDALKEKIRNNASKLFDPIIEKAELDVPAHWADRIYETMFRESDRRVMASAPDYMFATQEQIRLGGFDRAPDDWYQTGEFKMQVWATSNYARLAFSKPMPFPNDPSAAVIGIANPRFVSWAGTNLNYEDPMWDWLKPEFKDYQHKIFTAKARKAAFFAGLDKIMDTYTTLAPAIKAWQPLWDLLDDDIRERHLKTTQRKAKAEEELGIDLTKMTAAVALHKLTK